MSELSIFAGLIIINMILTYIFHSGFILETEKCILVIDYWMDPTHAMKTVLRSEKPLYVLSSHFHEDHFNPEIFTWRNQKSEITYILSKDILRHRRARKEEADVWMVKGSVWKDENLTLIATGSTDSGVSWIIETGGRRIFHAGDLNNWYARFLNDNFTGENIYSEEFQMEVNPVKEEKRYLGELKDIRKVTSHFDLVLFPVDGRIGNGYTRGARQFLEHFDVGYFVPMHFVASGFESAWRMKEFTDSEKVPFWCISQDGDSIRID